MLYWWGMCFSASASFASSGVLAVLGAGSIAISRPKNRILAIVPILFSLQQALEGVQWNSLTQGKANLFAAYGYLFFAFLVWPIYAPLVIYVLDHKQRRTTRWFLALGIVVALCLLTVLLTHPITPRINGNSIEYATTTPSLEWIVPLYVIAAVGAILLSSKKLFRWFGLIVLTSASIAWLFFSVTFVSVWCFFSALISGLIFYYLWSVRSRQ